MQLSKRNHSLKFILCFEAKSLFQFISLSILASSYCFFFIVRKQRCVQNTSRTNPLKRRMPPIIKILDEQTINQIAAGEVIENPASVIKELVENSLDAGSTEVVVEIAVGGRQLIRVIDNGCGMSSDDALLCLERHATSKIQKVNDILSVATMGFRGEALPSIASVSKMTLLTARENSDNQGTLVVVEGGSIIHHGPVPHSQGTTIEIKSLFYNVPVRRKFQKSIATDTAEIVKMMGEIALANPEVSFQLMCNQKILLSTHPNYAGNFSSQLQQAASDVLGADFLAATIPLDLKEGDLHLQGYIGHPSSHRHNRSGQHLFINQRAVSCPLVSYAVSEGYGTLLPPRRFPIYLLHLTLPGDLVDVNVHPQKKEVRLRSSPSLRSFISKAIEQSFQAPGESFSRDALFAAGSFASEDPFEYSLREETAFPPPPPIKEKQTSFFYLPEAPKETRPHQNIHQEASIFSFQPKLVGLWMHYILLDASCLPSEISLPPLFQDRAGLIMVDQRAAHARVLFEEMLKREHKIASQELLIPVHLEFSKAESHLLLPFLEDLNACGIGVRLFGQQTFIVDSLPQSMAATDVEILMSEILADLDRFSKDALLKNDKNRQAALSAAKASMNRHSFLSCAEAEELIKRLFRCDSPFQCPQGKATMTLFRQEEVAGKMKGLH